MKTIHLLLPLILALINFSCSRSVKKATNEMELSQDCFADRAVEEVLTGIEADVVKWQDIWLLTSADHNHRWQPCELPEIYCKEGTKVRFTGEVMRIFPGERRVASPLQLNMIVLISGDKK
ncbi:MAG: hypothetical protein IPH94_06910 [Saprospiraceae bacterium]|nr:hypothetical protein [Saprospiraceae bacterium]MBK7221062.1 hypothetical protein [Saprospiraceae bacterium]MBK8850853.1 hypothetical protein [Saprospiraceae bacterium]MBK9688119.1 hypothetical protein [Saprospiraceae bacterium]MBL0081299.1 hypothetical protein [Saprospiraceae bacterium]